MKLLKKIYKNEENSSFIPKTIITKMQNTKKQEWYIKDNVYSLTTNLRGVP